MAKSNVATWQLLYSGFWGIRVPSKKVNEGDEFEVKSRRGRIQSVTVESVEWTDGKECVCAIVDPDDDDSDEPELKPAKNVEKRSGKGKKGKASYIVHRGKTPAKVVQRGRVTYITLED